MATVFCCLLRLTTIGYVKSITRQVNHFAADRGLFTGEPPTTKFLRNQKIDNKRLRYLEPEEADRLLAELRKHTEQSYRMALLSLNSGMRFGEIAALRWQHVNAGRRKIIIVDPKNGQSRSVFMTEAVVSMFSEMPRGRQDEIIFSEGRTGQNNGPTKRHLRPCCRCPWT